MKIYRIASTINLSGNHPNNFRRLRDIDPSDIKSATIECKYFSEQPIAITINEQDNAIPRFEFTAYSADSKQIVPSSYSLYDLVKTFLFYDRFKGVSITVEV